MDIRFAYWMPVGIAGYVISKISQRTEWSFDYNKRLAQTAEEVGFEYGLAPAYTDEFPTFGRTVIPLVRKIEARQRVPILVA